MHHRLQSKHTCFKSEQTVGVLFYSCLMSALFSAAQHTTWHGNTKHSLLSEVWTNYQTSLTFSWTDMHVALTPSLVLRGVWMDSLECWIAAGEWYGSVQSDREMISCGKTALSWLISEPRLACPEQIVSEGHQQTWGDPLLTDQPGRHVPIDMLSHSVQLLTGFTVTSNSVFKIVFFLFWIFAVFIAGKANLYVEKHTSY